MHFVEYTFTSRQTILPVNLGVIDRFCFIHRQLTLASTFTRSGRVAKSFAAPVDLALSQGHDLTP